jgi:hypothetical protein
MGTIPENHSLNLIEYANTKADTMLHVSRNTSRSGMRMSFRRGLCIEIFRNWKWAAAGFPTGKDIFIGQVGQMFPAGALAGARKNGSFPGKISV